jgi:hypothetical protein
MLHLATPDGPEIAGWLEEGKQGGNVGGAFGACRRWSQEKSDDQMEYDTKVQRLRTLPPF